MDLSLALGSGGARGLAHIGVLQWLEKQDQHNIKSIAGTSMGALIGGLYAAGKLEQYTDWVTSLSKRDVMRVFEFAFSRSGLFSSERLIHKLEDMLGDVKIEDLPISFTAVAADIKNNHEVWFSRGSLFDAIHASIAIPTLFTPVKKDGRLLVDGGILNPVPVAPTLRENTDIIIAVSLSGREQNIEQNEEQDDQKNEQGKYQKAIDEFIDQLQEKVGINQDQSDVDFFDIISKSLELMQSSISRFRMASYFPDFLIEIPVDSAGLMDFHRASEMIDLGYQTADKTLKPLCKKA